MLAYLFWHWPAPGVRGTRYEEALLAFHRALLAEPCPGLCGSRVFAVGAATFLPVPSAFEDWYFVDDFAALGALNEAAVSGARREFHRAVAEQAGGGTGGLYRRLAEGPPPASEVSWLAKPAGLGYPEFLSRLPASSELWQRQLVLGPAPEFCLCAAKPAGLDGLAPSVRRLYP